MSKSLRTEDREDDQSILKFDKDALQQMCRVAVKKTEIRDHCELVIARNLYGPKKFRDLRMAEVQLSELRSGYLFPPGGQESIYLLKGAPSLPLHPCRASNVDALRQVILLSVSIKLIHCSDKNNDFKSSSMIKCLLR